MKLQDTLFTIRKISYPNSNTRHGKCKINLIAQGLGEETAAPYETISGTSLLQMTKECAQHMSHERYIISSIRQMRIIHPLAPKDVPAIMIEIHITPTEKEGTGLVHRMKAVCTRLGGDGRKFFEIAAELSPVK
jgi:hypothetical protein